MLGWTCQWINNSIIRKSMFSVHKKKSHHKFHCSPRYEINHCCSLFYTKTYKCSIPKTLHTCMWYNSWKIYHQNKPQTNSLAAPSHSLFARHQEICRPCHSSASPKSKSGKSIWNLSIWKIFTGLSFSWRLILTMPSLEKQPWMRLMCFNLLQL